MKKRTLEQFTNQYQLSKTLRFELIPQGKTLSHIQAKGLIDEDEQRAKSYKKVKEIIDNYHKNFIELALKNLNLVHLESFAELYNKSDKSDKEKKEYGNLQTALRKQVADVFGKSKDDKIKSMYKNLFKKELIQKDLLELVEGEEKTLVEGFKNFTTYFTGFHENRQNISSKFTSLPSVL